MATDPKSYTLQTIYIRAARTFHQSLTMAKERAKSIDPDILSRLDLLVREDITNLFVGEEVNSNAIPTICRSLIEVVERFLDPNNFIDLTDISISNFLTHTLPALVEAFLRRRSAR